MAGGSKAERGTSKYLGIRMKSKGLQKLKFFCQICEKQCRDEVSNSRIFFFFIFWGFCFTKVTSILLISHQTLLQKIEFYLHMFAIILALSLPNVGAISTFT